MEKDYYYIAQEPPVLYRIGAFVIDLVLRGVAIQVLLIMLAIIYSKFFKDVELNEGVAFLIFLILGFCFNGCWYYFYEATPGKMIFKLKVKMMNGKPIGFFVGGFRDTFIHPIFATFFITYIVGAFRDDQRCLHDLIVGSRLMWFEKVYKDSSEL